jgi:hypothetical protein
LPLKKERATTKAHTAHQKCKNLSNNQNPRTTLPSDFFSNIEAVTMHLTKYRVPTEV